MGSSRRRNPPRPTDTPPRRGFGPQTTRRSLVSLIPNSGQEVSTQSQAREETTLGQEEADWDAPKEKDR